jgi:hypothetical protein
MSGAGNEVKKPRLAEHEVEHVVSIMEMVRVCITESARGSRGAYNSCCCRAGR